MSPTTGTARNGVLDLDRNESARKQHAAPAAVPVVGDGCPPQLGNGVNKTSGDSKLFYLTVSVALAELCAVSVLCSVAVPVLVTS